MKRSSFFALLLVVGSLLLFGGCAGVVSDPIASSGRSGCNNINMADADIRNDPANGLPPVPKN